MTTAGCIIGEHDVTGTETFYGAVAGFNLDRPRKRNHVLAPRRRMVTVQVISRRAPEKNPLGGLGGANFHIAAEF